MNRRYTTIFASFLLCLLSLAGLLCQAVPAQALTGSQFQAGHIIDDNVFGDSGSMDIPTIQAFLDSKVPTCDTNGTLDSGHGMTRAAWGTQNGYPPPYTCLKDYTVSSYGYAADQYCKAINYGGYSAAGVIYTVAHACNISPKVLIVLLQKEQALITDDWPWSIEYTAATGYGCPDTASCDPSFSGFFNQVYYAARQYDVYAQKASEFNFQRNTTPNIHYSPTSSCGSSAVYLQNQATAGLYNYTPYQPDQAALNNLNGTGDSCSAYGNRNFWVYYNNWFGNTYGIPYTASFVGESGVIDTVTDASNPTVWVEYQNTGADFWKDSTSAPSYYPVTRLEASWPDNRISQFYDPSTWYSASRPVQTFAAVYESDGTTLAADQHTVWPGQIAKFQFDLKYSPNIPSSNYFEHFDLVEDGIPNFWVNGSDFWQLAYVPPPFNASFSGESSTGVTVSPSSQKANVWFKFQNTGSQFWKDANNALPYYPQTHLMATWPVNRVSAFYDPSTWLNSSRPVSNFAAVYNSDGTTFTSDQNTVWPGQIAKFQFDMMYPSGGIAPGNYQENFELVQDGIPNFWVPGSYAWNGVTVTN